MHECMVPLKKTLTLYFLSVSVLFSETFDVLYDKSSSFYKLSCGWVWLSLGFLGLVCLLKELCLVVVVL